jgi:tripartite-type tricarboxylate transporter receptor subunit TctC
MMEESNMSAQKKIRIGTLLRAVTLGVASLAALTAQPAWSQAFPSKPLRMIVPFPAGGITDTVGRVIADKMSKQMGQPFVIDNRGGAGGMIGLDAIIKSDPDGYTMGLMASPTLISGLLNGRDWNVENDFTPIGLNYRQGMLFSLNPTVPELRGVRTGADLVRAVKANPGKINFASIGIGSTGHLIGEIMGDMAGMKWVHVPYKGTAPLVQELIAGQVPLVMVGGASDDPVKYPGRVIVVATSGAKRHPLNPDAPTLAESGFPGLDATTWGAFVGPGKIPAPIAARLAAEYKVAFDNPDMRDKLNAQVLQEYMTPADLARLTREAVQMWGKVIKEKNIKAQ